MALIIKKNTEAFDTTQIKRGCLCYARHQSWLEGKGGFMIAVSEQEIIIQYHPGIGNITNHFSIQAQEVAAGAWEFRWSEDLKVIKEYQKGGTDDSGGTDLSQIDSKH